VRAVSFVLPSENRFPEIDESLHDDGFTGVVLVDRFLLFLRNGLPNLGNLLLEEFRFVAAVVALF
jgi:hypothetical protein